MNNILFVEDDELFGETIADFLGDNGFCVSLCPTVADALEQSYRRPFDLWLLDVRLPDESGLSLLSQLRDAGMQTPAIVLTSLDRPNDALDGFEAGCDDFLRKSCSSMELLARIKALLRRSYRQASSIVQLGGELAFDTQSKTLTLQGKELQLSPKEAELAALLVRNMGSTVTLELIGTQLWGSDEESSYGAIRVYVTKLKKIFGKERLVNVKSIGYRLLKS